MRIRIGFAMCGSFCTFAAAFSALEALIAAYPEAEITPIMSEAAAGISSRFGTAEAHRERLTALCGRPPLRRIEEAEPIGPKQLFDVLAVCPCTGNTLAKLAHGIADGPVTMACKSHLRNARPLVLAVATNDALFTAAPNVGALLSRRNVYFVPMAQDDPAGKPASLIARMERLPETVAAALEGRQLQPLLG